MAGIKRSNEDRAEIFRTLQSLIFEKLFWKPSGVQGQIGARRKSRKFPNVSKRHEIMLIRKIIRLLSVARALVNICLTLILDLMVITNSKFGQKIL